MVTILPIPGLPRIRPGDDLPQLLARAVREAGITLAAGDVVAVCQKVVSKAEGAVAACRAVPYWVLQRSPIADQCMLLYPEGFLATFRAGADRSRPSRLPEPSRLSQKGFDA